MEERVQNGHAGFCGNLEVVIVWLRFILRIVPLNS